MHTCSSLLMSTSIGGGGRAPSILSPSICIGFPIIISWQQAYTARVRHFADFKGNFFNRRRAIIAIKYISFWRLTEKC